MSYPFKNLVFEGGGVKGIAYAGAIEVLETSGVLQQIGAVAGTSAGAITAALVSMRFSAAEIKEIIWDTKFSTFEDHKSYIHIFTKYGLYEGDTFLAWMKSQVAAWVKKK